MKLLLTGPSSFLGTKFLELYGDVYETVTLGRANSDYICDLTDDNKVRQVVSEIQPEVIVHIASLLGKEAEAGADITVINPRMLENLISAALPTKTPIIFTSSEAVYGGKEFGGEYTEEDARKPRSAYGQSKVICEDLLMNSGLPYLITRAHRYVGISKNFNRSKQFPDALKEIEAGKVIHVDNLKNFKPVLINHLCDVINYYIVNDLLKKIVINVGTDPATTYYGFLVKLTGKLGLKIDIIYPDGEEAGWPENSLLSISRLSELGYPYIDEEAMLETIKLDFTEK